MSLNNLNDVSSGRGSPAASVRCYGGGQTIDDHFMEGLKHRTRLSSQLTKMEILVSYFVEIVNCISIPIAYVFQGVGPIT